MLYMLVPILETVGGTQKCDNLKERYLTKTLQGQVSDGRIVKPQSS